MHAAKFVLPTLSARSGCFHTHRTNHATYCHRWAHILFSVFVRSSDANSVSVYLFVNILDYKLTVKSFYCLFFRYAKDIHDTLNMAATIVKNDM